MKTLSYDFISHGQIKYAYQLTKPIYICDNIEKILHFISVWQYLESERLIIELPKSCEEKDMALFLRKEPAEITSIALHK